MHTDMNNLSFPEYWSKIIEFGIEQNTDNSSIVLSNCSILNSLINWEYDITNTSYKEFILTFSIHFVLLQYTIVLLSTEIH